MDKLAFKNVEGLFYKVDIDEIKKGIQLSRSHRRKRIILPLHRTQDALVQRMINFLQPDTYIRPHLHPRNSASESVVVVQGSVTLYLFDQVGNITSKTVHNTDLGSNLFDLEPNIYHCFVVNEPDTVIYEFKMGPYNTELDKKFASWSPEEFSDDAPVYLNYLKKQ